MEKKLNQLIEKALEGIEYALNPDNKLYSLPGAEVLSKIRKGLLNYKKDKNLTKLRGVLGVYKKSNMLTSGKTEYNAVWYQTVNVRGKSELLGSIFDDMEDVAWELMKTNVN